MAGYIAVALLGGCSRGDDVPSPREPVRTGSTPISDGLMRSAEPPPKKGVRSSAARTIEWRVNTARRLPDYRSRRLVAVPRRPDSVPARGKDPFRVDGILDRLCEVPVGVVTEGELVLREV